MQMLVIGCGNRLRGDDAAGPLVVERLSERAPPGGIRCLDAGTAGVAAVLAMRGAEYVVFVDACMSGAEPGTIRELSAADVMAATAGGGELSTHGIRWDQALVLARAVLGDAVPRRVSVYLIEAGTLAAGARLSPAVERAVKEVAERLLAQAAAGR